MNVRTLIAVAMVWVAVFGVPSVPSFRASVVVEEPSDQMKEVVKPVVRVVSKMNAVDRLWLHGIYKNASAVVLADGMDEPEVINTTEGLRAVHVAILKFIWKGMAGNPPGQYEGLKEAIDGAMNEAIGDTQRPMTPEMRQKAADVFEAIAWAGLGKG